MLDLKLSLLFLCLHAFAYLFTTANADALVIPVSVSVSGIDDPLAVSMPAASPSTCICGCCSTPLVNSLCPSFPVYLGPALVDQAQCAGGVDRGKDMAYCQEQCAQQYSQCSQSQMAAFCLSDPSKEDFATFSLDAVESMASKAKPFSVIDNEPLPSSSLSAPSSVFNHTCGCYCNRPDQSIMWLGWAYPGARSDPWGHFDCQQPCLQQNKGIVQPACNPANDAYFGFFQVVASNERSFDCPGSVMATNFFALPSCRSSLSEAVQIPLTCTRGPADQNYEISRDFVFSKGNCLFFTYIETDIPRSMPASGVFVSVLGGGSSWQTIIPYTRTLETVQMAINSVQLGGCGSDMAIVARAMRSVMINITNNVNC